MMILILHWYVCCAIHAYFCVLCRSVFVIAEISACILRHIVQNRFDVYMLQIYWIQEHIFIGVWHSKKVGILLYVIFAEILFWAALAGIFHRLKIYWKL